jgi:hypothetical protein
LALTPSSTSRDPFTRTPAAIRNRRLALYLRRRRQQQPLGVVTARNQLDDSGPVGEQSSQQHARLHLGAGDGELVFDPVQPRAVDRERREAPAGRLDHGAHPPQWLGDPVHGPEADRLVAVERERMPALPRQPAGQQPHQRAGVADVDLHAGRLRVAQAHPPDDQLLGLLLHDRAQLLDGRQRGVGVGGVEVVADPHGL